MRFRKMKAFSLAIVACVAATLLTGCAQQSGLDQLKEYEKNHPCTGQLAQDRYCTLMSRIELQSGKDLAKAVGLKHIYQARLAPAHYGWAAFALLGTRCIVGFNSAGIESGSNLLTVAVFPRYGTESQPTAFNGAVRANLGQTKELIAQLRQPCTSGSGKGGGLDPSMFPPVLPDSQST